MDVICARAEESKGSLRDSKDWSAVMSERPIKSSGEIARPPPTAASWIPQVSPGY